MFIYKKQTTTSKNQTTMKTLNDIVLDNIKSDIFNIYIPYFEKVAHGKFTTSTKHRIVLEVIKKHSDCIKSDYTSEMILRVYDMLNDILNKR